MAVTLHGYYRFTEYVDLFFYLSNENAIKQISAFDFLNTSKDTADAEALIKITNKK